MHYDRAYDLLRQELEELHHDTTCMYVGVEKALVDDNKELQARMLELIQERIDGVDKEFVNQIVSAICDVQNEDTTVRKTVDDIKQLSDVLLSFVGRLINKQIGLVDAKKVYSRMIESETNFGPQQEAEDILDAVIEGVRQ